MSYTLAYAAAQRLRESLLDHGVKAVSIELQPGRPGTPNGGWLQTGQVTAMAHHIASTRSQGLTPGLYLVKHGRSDLPGPLANVYGGFDEVSRIICMGWANHPGEGGPLTIRGRVIPRDNGRPYLLGTEFEGGIRESDWTTSFREFMGRHNAGVLDYLGAGPNDHIEHKTWAPTRKIDRLNYTTTSGRAEVARWWDEGADMPLNAADKEWIKACVIRAIAGALTGRGNSIYQIDDVNSHLWDVRHGPLGPLFAGTFRIQVQGKDPQYVVSNGVRRWIPSPDKIEEWGLGNTPVIVVPDEEDEFMKLPLVGDAPPV